MLMYVGVNCTNLSWIWIRIRNEWSDTDQQPWRFLYNQSALKNVITRTQIFQVSLYIYNPFDVCTMYVTVARWPNFRPKNSKQAAKKSLWKEKVGRPIFFLICRIFWFDWPDKQVRIWQQCTCTCIWSVAETRNKYSMVSSEL